MINSSTWKTVFVPDGCAVDSFSGCFAATRQRMMMILTQGIVFLNDIVKAKMGGVQEKSKLKSSIKYKTILKNLQGLIFWTDGGITINISSFCNTNVLCTANIIRNPRIYRGK